MAITGTKQGAFKGQGLVTAYASSIEIHAFQYGVQSPRDVSTGLASGKRQHSPITVTKEWGQATPQIFQALTTNEVLTSVKFQFTRTDPTGKTYVYHTITLTNATISAMTQHTDKNARHQEANDTLELEDVSFTFQAITIENIDGKTSATDDWAAS